jgi:hypothetical protein
LYLRREFFFVQAEGSSVLPDKTPGEHAAGELVELLVLDGIQQARGDLCFARDLLEAEVSSKTLTP